MLGSKDSTPLMKCFNAKGLIVPSSDSYVSSHQAPSSIKIHELFLSSGALDARDYLEG